MRNKYEIKGNEVYIKASCEGSTVEVVVDLGVFERINETITGRINVRHTSPQYGKCFYAYYNMLEDGERKHYPLHRLITNCPDGLVVDHIDGDTLNNRSSNLRCITQQENCQNQRVRKNNTSGERGVSWDEKKNRWIASVYVQGKCYRKVKKTFEEAVEAVKELRAVHMPYSII